MRRRGSSFLSPSRALALLAAAGWGGCGSDASDYDPFGIPIDTSTGAAMIQVRERVTDRIFWAPIDTLSPLSVVDSAADGRVPEPPRRRQVSLELLGLTLGEEAEPVARARFDSAVVIDLHPCGGQGTCVVGTEDTTMPLGGIIGADVLSRSAVRFSMPDAEVRFFPEIAGSSSSRARACEAVFPSPFFGGGTLQVSGSELSYSGRRIAVGACADYQPREARATRRGVNMMLLVSTAVGTTVVTDSAYRRYRAFYGDAADAPPPVDALPEASVYLSSGPVSGRLGSLDRLALVGEGSAERGPCTELHANHVMTYDACRQPDDDLPLDSCPCTSGQFCSTAAAVELDRTIEVLIVPDENEYLQALRDELRPALPEVDGIVGLDALADLGMDVDYPNGRLLFRCLERDECTARPAVHDDLMLGDLLSCPGI